MQSKSTNEQSEPTLTLDERFEILKNNRRRLVLQHLQETDGSIKLGDLADHVTAIENDTDIDSITSSERKRVYVGLYQFHLPKMADMGIINYDKDRGDVSLTPKGENLYQEQKRHTQAQRQWHRVYMGLAVVGGVSFIGCLIVRHWLITSGVLGVLTVLLGFVAIAHMIDFRS